jgi:hypothetical protein
MLPEVTTSCPVALMVNGALFPKVSAFTVLFAPIVMVAPVIL